ncbi:MAG: acyl carrier protein [Promethearchaeota archaeon]
MNENEKFKNVLSEILKIESDQIKNDITPDDIENWNSINHLKLIVRFEELFNIEINSEDIAEMDSFGAIKDILKKYGVNL